MNIFGESGIVEWYESDTPAFQKVLYIVLGLCLTQFPGF